MGEGGIKCGPLGCLGHGPCLLPSTQASPLTYKQGQVLRSECQGSGERGERKETTDDYAVQHFLTSEETDLVVCSADPTV